MFESTAVFKTGASKANKTLQCASKRIGFGKTVSFQELFFTTLLLEHWVFVGYSMLQSYKSLYLERAIKKTCLDYPLYAGRVE